MIIFLQISQFSKQMLNKRGLKQVLDDLYKDIND